MLAENRVDTGFADRQSGKLHYAMSWKAQNNPCVQYF